jgi:copper resistance protein B
VLVWASAILAAETESLPEPDAAERAAAFPVLAHPMHRHSVMHSLVVVDQLEFAHEHGVTTGAFDVHGWLGGDVQRLWMSVEGEGERESEGDTEFSGRLEAHYGRGFAPWWDALVGIRLDHQDGRDRTALSAGIRGLAPWFVESALYVDVDTDGDAEVRIEAEYNLLLTQRLILQPDIEASWYGGADSDEFKGTGFGSVEAALRLRYEVTREFAPYVGIVHERFFGKTADRRHTAGESVRSTLWVAGFRFWF